MDIHSPFTTVREALDFSASLRLPASVTKDQRLTFVTGQFRTQWEGSPFSQLISYSATIHLAAAPLAEIMDLLELSTIADRKVGEIGAADGLAPGQRKILTIGVELASNCPILFLDEPTSGGRFHAIGSNLCLYPLWTCVLLALPRSRCP